jgi:hypothetical protein
MMFEQVRQALLVGAMFCACPAGAADATFSVKILTPETALKAAQAAVAVVDRMGG